MAAPGLGVDGAAAASADVDAQAEDSLQARLQEYIQILLPLKPGDADSSASSCAVALLREEKYPEIVQCFHGQDCAWDTQTNQFQGPPNWEAVLCRLQALLHPGGPPSAVSTTDTPTAKVKKGSPESYKRQVCWSSLPPASSKACARGEGAHAMRACSRV